MANGKHGYRNAALAGAAIGALVGLTGTTAICSQAIYQVPGAQSIACKQGTGAAATAGAAIGGIFTGVLVYATYRLITSNSL